MKKFDELAEAIILNNSYDSIKKYEKYQLEVYCNKNLKILYKYVYENDNEMPEVIIDFPRPEIKEIRMYRDEVFREDDLELQVYVFLCDFYYFGLRNGKEKYEVNIKIEEDGTIDIEGRIEYSKGQIGYPWEYFQGVRIKYDNENLIFEKYIPKSNSNIRMININECSIERVINEIYLIVLNSFDVDEWKNNIFEMFESIKPALILHIMEIIYNYTNEEKAVHRK